MKNFLLVSSLLFSIAAFAKPEPLPTAKNVDVARYAGKWYTIASLPQFFTRNCDAQTAEYGVINEKEISIKNTCIKKDKEDKNIQGKGTVVDKENHARLEIKLDSFWAKFFKRKGDYVIIKLSEGYDSVLVGSTDRKSLWIMSRTTTIDPTLLVEYKKLANDLKFPVTQLKNAKY